MLYNRCRSKQSQHFAEYSFTDNEVYQLIESVKQELRILNVTNITNYNIYVVLQMFLVHAKMLKISKKVKNKPRKYYINTKFNPENIDSSDDEMDTESESDSETETENESESTENDSENEYDTENEYETDSDSDA